MKKILLFALIAIVSIATISAFTSKDSNDLKEGDIVFQISKSRQSPFVQLATASPWSHCGIIVYKNGKPYVLEASNVVKLTELQKWINRGKGKIWRSKRVLDDCPKIQYKKYLGQPYDLAFKFDNNKMYCSELVYVIYRNKTMQTKKNILLSSIRFG